MRELVFLLISSSLIAQSPKGDYSIGGTVMDSQTGEAVKNALVSLTEMPVLRNNGTPPVPRAARPSAASLKMLTGIGGEFQFNGLAEGQYNLTAEKPGFTRDLKRNDPIKLSSSMTGVRLQLSALGVVEGKVVNQYGEPVRRVNVIAMRMNINDGRRVTSSDRSVATDDLGMYRLWNLQPGKYYIKAAGKSGGTYTYVGDNGPSYDAWESFAPIYSGGAHELDSATPVEIAYGAHGQADIEVTLEPAVKIRGALENFVPHQTVKFELLSGGEDVAASRVSLNGTNGRFEIQDVTPGTYVLRATQNKKTRAEMTITIKGTDMNDVALSLAPGVPVRAVVRTIGAASAPQHSTENKVSDFRDRIPSSCQASLRPSDRSPEQIMLAPDNSGGLSAEQVLPGDYHVTLQCFGGYVTSATAGSADLLSTPRLVVQSGVPPPRIEITMMHGGGMLKGKLVVNPLPARPAILLVPAFSASTGPLFQPIFGMPESSEGMIFGVSFLAPGEYTVYAFSRQDEIEFRNPTFLQSLSGGTSVRIEQSGDQEITLTSVVK